MVWIIIGIILGIALFFLLGVDYYKESWKLQKRQFVAFVAVLFILPSFITKIPANSVGIVYNPFASGVSEETLSEGFHFKNPFAKIYKFSTEVQTLKLDDIVTQTNDSQYVINVLDVKYAVNSENAYLVFKQFRTLEKMSEVLISPTVQRTVELITTQYNVIDVLGEARNEIYSTLQSNLAEELTKYGITFYSVTLVDTDAGENIEKAIEREAIAKKEVETAEQELLKAQTEAQQVSVKAQAEKDASVIKAETLVIEAQADADAKLIKAKAEAESNRLLEASLSDAVLRKLLLDRWSGNFPLVYGADTPIMDITSILTK